MVLLAIDALAAFLLLKAISGREFDYRTAGLTAICGIAAMKVIVSKLPAGMGYAGLLIVIPVSGLLLGLALAWGLRVKVNPACFAATIFAVVHVATELLMYWMLGRV